MHVNMLILDDSPPGLFYLSALNQLSDKTTCSYQDILFTPMAGTFVNHKLHKDSLSAVTASRHILILIVDRC